MKVTFENPDKVNGLMTYDRKVIKINEAEVRKANQEVIKALSE